MNNFIKKMVVVSVLVFFSVTNGYGQLRTTQSADGYMLRPVSVLKKTVVFLGRIDHTGKPQIYATGSLVNVKNTYHLLTAKHVIVDPASGRMKDEDLLVFLNLKGGGVTIRSIDDMKKDFGVKWVFHTDPKVDVAMIPFLINTQDDDVRVMSDTLFLSPEKLFELYDVFFLSYQPGIAPRGKITPIVRNGVISLINQDNTFYIDASAFPGNTGSPVFLKPSIIRFGEKGFTIGKDPVGGRFVGIIGEYITYQEVAVSSQTGRPRIVFEENTGLAKVWSVKFIQEIINSPDFKQQLKIIAERKPK